MGSHRRHVGHLDGDDRRVEVGQPQPQEQAGGSAVGAQGQQHRPWLGQEPLAHLISQLECRVDVADAAHRRRPTGPEDIRRARRKAELRVAENQPGRSHYRRRKAARAYGAGAGLLQMAQVDPHLVRLRLLNEDGGYPDTQLAGVEGGGQAVVAAGAAEGEDG